MRPCIRRVTIAAVAAITLALMSCAGGPGRDINNAVQDIPLLFFIKRTYSWMAVEYGNEKESVVIIRDPPNNGPVIGRWFPKASVTEQLDGNVLIHLDGYGYSGHKLASNVFFRASSECLYKMNINSDIGNFYSTFIPVSEPKVSFHIFHITASGGVGGIADTPENRAQATKIGVEVFTDAIKQGFTVAMERVKEGQIWLGIGPRPDQPSKPYWATPGDHDVVNEFVRIREDGKDFIGPIRVHKGDQLSLKVQTECGWGMDCYLVENSVVLGALASHVDPENNPPREHFVLAKQEGTKSWEQTLPVTSDGVVWLIVDNANGGGATPPTDGVDNILDATVYIGLVRAKQ
ncbi:MAG: hypothetical protein IT462_16100 [Planctomycetes bacterium]|nr:hypothetical protein [Planctomycetota bacterium]